MKQTMTSQIGTPNKPALVHKVVFELRYRYGFAYLDRCGRITNYILQHYPAWILAETSPNPQNAPLINTEDNCRFNLSALKLDFALEQGVGEGPISEESVFRFAEEAEILVNLVIREMDLKEFSRIGFRVWNLFACENPQEAEEWLMGLGCYTVDRRLESAFHGRLQSSSLSTVIESTDRNYRIAFTNVERTIPLNLGEGILNIPARALPSGQKEHLLKQIKLKKRLSHNPQYAAMVDIDCYQDEPQEIKVSEFILSSLKIGLSTLREVVEKHTR
jgi:hypothetical protein